MTSLKIRKIGNSLGVVLPKDLLERLNVGEGDTLAIQHDDQGIHLKVSDAEIDRLMELAEEIIEENRNVLKVLAK
jgi:putative addiction module antidote